MPNNKLAEALAELELASRIAANEGVLDTFGHVSMRHPNNPRRYFLSKSSSPDMVTAEGLIEYDLDSRPVQEPGAAQYSDARRAWYPRRRVLDVERDQRTARDA